VGKLSLIPCLLKYNVGSAESITCSRNQALALPLEADCSVLLICLFSFFFSEVTKYRFTQFLTAKMCREGLEVVAPASTRLSTCSLEGF
jgi:hypothetical protein